MDSDRTIMVDLYYDRPDRVWPTTECLAGKQVDLITAFNLDHMRILKRVDIVVIPPGSRITVARNCKPIILRFVLGGVASGQ